MMFILVLGNFLAFLSVEVYWLSNKNTADKKLVDHVTAARLLLSLSFFLMLLRSSVPDLLSVNLGNTLLILGFYAEGIAMLLISKNDQPRTVTTLRIVAIGSIILFNAAEALHTSASLRVTAASLGVFFVIAIPSIKMLFTRSATAFKRFVGFLYCLLAALLLPRAIYASINQETDIFSGYLFQILTFMALIMILVFSLSVFLLLLKEESDAVILALATTDSMTELFNRQHFLAEAAKSIQRHRRDGTSFCIMYVDIDHFKAVNDTYGHSFGDKVIKKTAAIMKHTTRPYDLLSRFGGEEFVIMLSNAGEQAGLSVAKRLHDQINQTVFAELPDFSYTISIGVRPVDSANENSIMTLIDQADKALYQAKQSGRNRTVISGRDISIAT